MSEKITIIPATELRIGNVGRLWHFWGKRWTPLLKLTGEHIFWLSENKTDFKPVELGTLILEKICFEYYPWEAALQFQHMIKGEIVLRLHDAGVSVFRFSPCNPADINFVCRIKYLHQLQNIFFMIMEEELKIDLR